MQQTERVIVLPVRDNNGVSLAREVASIKRDILALSGGYSESRQSGVWLDGNKAYRDSSWRVSIVTDEATDAEIVARLPYWCGRLRQVCLFTTSTPVIASFVGQETETGEAVKAS